MSEDLVIKFGSLREIKLDHTTVLVKEYKQMYKALNEIKYQHRPLVKNPPLTVRDEKTGQERTETGIEWRNRVLSAYLTTAKKRDDESDEAFDARMMALALADSKITIAFEFVNKVCEVLKLEPVTQDQFDEATWDSIRTFCNDIMLMGEVSDPDGMFLAPERETRTAEQTGLAGTEA